MIIPLSWLGVVHYSGWGFQHTKDLYACLIRLYVCPVLITEMPLLDIESPDKNLASGTHIQGLKLVETGEWLEVDRSSIPRSAIGAERMDRRSIWQSKRYDDQ